MIITDHPDGKLIILSKQFDNASKITATIYFALFFISGILLFYLTLRDLTNDNITIGILLALLPLTLIFAAYKYINKATKGEQLIVNRTSITHVNGGLTTTRKFRYEVRRIENFRHVVKQATIPQQYEGQPIDYLVQTRKLTSEDLRRDSKVAFDYKGLTIELDEPIYSWEYNELAIALYDITGYDFQIPVQVEEIAADNDVEP